MEARFAGIGGQVTLFHGRRGSACFDEATGGSVELFCEPGMRRLFFLCPGPGPACGVGACGRFYLWVGIVQGAQGVQGAGLSWVLWGIGALDVASLVGELRGCAVLAD